MGPSSRLAEPSRSVLIIWSRLIAWQTAWRTSFLSKGGFGCMARNMISTESTGVIFNCFAFSTRARILFDVGVVRTLLQHQALSGNQFLQSIRAAAHHMFFVRHVATVLVIDGFTGDDQPITQKRQ